MQNNQLNRSIQTLNPKTLKNQKKKALTKIGLTSLTNNLQSINSIKLT